MSFSGGWGLESCERMGNTSMTAVASRLPLEGGSGDHKAMIVWRWEGLDEVSLSRDRWGGQCRGRIGAWDSERL